MGRIGARFQETCVVNGISCRTEEFNIIFMSISTVYTWRQGRQTRSIDGQFAELTF